MMDRLHRKIERLRNELLHRKVLRGPLSRGIVSFIFDDFPWSAYLVRREILKSHQLRGTYYTAFGLMGRENTFIPQFLDEARETLLCDGHELGCYAYSHADFQMLGPKGLAEEIARNEDFFGKFRTNYKVVNFSYPFGGITPGMKRVVGQRFMTGRRNWPGLNDVKIDLACLRANSLYSRGTAFHEIERLVAKNEKKRGRLIFYTHDASDAPSPYGCTPDFFEKAVGAAVSSNCEVLPVRNTLRALSIAI